MNFTIYFVKSEAAHVSELFLTQAQLPFILIAAAKVAARRRLRQKPLPASDVPAQ